MGEINDVYKLWRIRKTIYEMCNDRGYKITHVLLNESLDFFSTYYDQLPSKSAQTMVFKHSTDPSNTMLVFFNGNEKISNTCVKTYLTKMLEEGASRAILIVPSLKSITPSGKKDIEDAAPTYNIEVFTETELLVNVTKHKLVPQHILLSQEEASNVLQQYRAQVHQLPRILITDPIARYYGMKKGQIVKIIRNSETAGVYITYRAVV